MQPELAPELEGVLVAQQHVAAGLEIEFLPDALARECLPDREPMALLDERYVVDDEDPGLVDAREIIDHPLGAVHAVAAPIEGPGAAECAIPGTAAGELN